MENFAWLVSQGFDFNGKFVKQTADIALNAPFEQWEDEAPTPWTPIASPRTHEWYSSSIANEFRGVYDGDFHEVQNMWVNSLEERNQGLFGTLGTGAELRNLGVTDAYIRANGNVGVLVGYLPDWAVVSQCWTSGDVSWKTEYGAGIGGIAGYISKHGRFLNCSSSAKLNGGIGGNTIQPLTDAVHGTLFHVWAEDTIVNYLFTGIVNGGGESVSAGNFQYRENVFVDKDKAKVAHQSTAGEFEYTTDGTEWSQSKELVNIYNYSVSRWNARHGEDLQLNYWEWREGDYPRVSHDANWKPEVKISFLSNGGAPVEDKYVQSNSESLPPQRPSREGYIFAGWFKDAGLTQFYDWKAERPTSNVTLYAKWLEDTRFDIDITPFQNEFAKKYKIKTAAQLRGFAALQNGAYNWGEPAECYGQPVSQTVAPMDFKGKTIVLENDIFLNDTTDWQNWGRGAFGVPWQSIGSKNEVESEPSHPFHGTFDGQGHTIYGLFQEMHGAPGDQAGLFGLVNDSAIIRNVGIAASVIDLQRYNTRGQNSDAVWLWRRCDIGENHWDRVGLLAGWVVGAPRIEQCFTEGKIFVEDANFYGLAGFIGSLGDEFVYENLEVKNCYTRADIIHTSKTGTLSYEPSDYGFTALGKQNPIINSYSAGRTTLSFCNGNNYYADQVTDCHYDKELVQGQVTVMDGRVFIAEPNTTNEMHAKSTFTNWDFENVWGRHDTINAGYPYLRVFHVGAPDSPDAVKVTGVTLNVTDTTLIGGQSLQLIATILPEEALDKRITWSSDAPGSSWFTLDENGLVTTVLDLTPYDPMYYGTREANITITVTTAEGSYTATCKIKIVQPKINTKILSKRRHGETEWAEYKGYPEAVENFEYMVVTYTIPDAAKMPLTWSSDDESVVTVTPMSDTTFAFSPDNDPWGNYRCARAMVRCLKAGNTTVHATAESGLTAERGFNPQLIGIDYIAIYQPPTYQGYYGLVYPEPDDELSVNETRQLAVMAGNYTGTTDVSYLPEVEWSSSNQSVLSVDQTGLIKAVGAGSATITATVIGGTLTNTTREITVAAVEVESVQVETVGGTDMYEWQTKQLSAVIWPENASDKSVTWRSENTELATVDQNGLVTARKPGYVRIYAKATNDREGDIELHIQAVPIHLEPYEATMEVDDMQQLVVRAGTANEPMDIDLTGRVSWSSDKPEIVYVDEAGIATARSIGAATITATTISGQTATANINVEGPVVEVIYDVAEAIAAQAADEIHNDDSISVRGVITKMEFKPKNFSSYGNVSIYVSDPTGDQGEFEFYNCLSLNKEKFTGSNPIPEDMSSKDWFYPTLVTDGQGNEVAINDTIIARGKYLFYRSEVHELNQNCFLLEIKKASTTPEGIENEPIEADRPRKVIIDGQIYIFRGDKTYTIHGQELK